MAMEAVEKDVIQGFAVCNLFKRDSNTGVFLWNFQNFYEYLILKNICEQLLLLFKDSDKL